ncbi:MAG: hypothetical protein AB1705_01865 [Verrucomicrobiota bacterium]
MNPIRLLLLAWLLAHVSASSFAADSKHPPGTLRVMTYNLRFASPKPPNAWPDRRPLMRDCIRQYAPDVIGTQEGVYYQLRELASALGEYASA